MKKTKLLSVMLITAVLATYLTPISSLATGNLPRKFDLREENRVTASGQQGSLNSDWAIANNLSLESTLLSNGGEIYNFSENNMMTQLSSYYKESYKRGPDEKGNLMMAMGYYSAWRGPVLEEDDHNSKTLTPKDIVTRPGVDINKYVQGALFLPKRKNAKDNDSLKNMIMQYGAVAMNMWIGEGSYSKSSIYYNADTNAYYYPKTYKNSTGMKYIINIIGWDDDFSKENFIQKPDGDGAFIAEISKDVLLDGSTGKSNNGIFYISYYDAMLGDKLDDIIGSTVFTRIDDTQNYDNMYHYDLLGPTETLRSSKNSVWFGNIFTLDKGRNESVRAVSFYTFDSDLKYEVYIQENFSGTVVNSKMKLVAKGKQPYAGYHTIDFQVPYSVNNEKEVFVAVKLISTKSKPSVGFQTSWKVEGQTENLGKSLYKGDGNWINLGLKNYIASLKIFTDENPEELMPVHEMQKDVGLFIDWESIKGNENPYSNTVNQVIQAMKEPLPIEDYIIQLRILYREFETSGDIFGHPNRMFLNMNYKVTGKDFIVTEDSNCFRKGDEILTLGGYDFTELRSKFGVLTNTDNQGWLEKESKVFFNDKAYLDYFRVSNGDGTVDVEVKRNNQVMILRAQFENIATYNHVNLPDNKQAQKKEPIIIKSKTDTHNGQYRVKNYNNNKNKEITSVPLKIRYELEYKSWNAFQMSFNKGIQVNSEPIIIIKKGDELIKIKEVATFGEKDGKETIYFSIRPHKKLTKGTYEIIIPAGVIESADGEVLDQDIHAYIEIQ